MLPHHFYWIGFWTYALIVLAIGLRVYRREKGGAPGDDTRGFWSAGQRLSGTAAGLSISASMMSISWSCVYGVQLFYWYGLGAAWLLIIPWLMAMAGYFLLAPAFRRMPAFSQPEMLGQRFGPRARQLLAPALIFVFIVWCGAELYAASTVMAPLLQTSPAVMLVLIAVIVAAYSYLGGFQAVVSTDKIQFALVALFITVMAGIGVAPIIAGEGVTRALATLPSPPKTDAGALAFFSPGFALIGLTLVAYLPGWLVETDVWVRLQAAADVPRARRGALIASLNSLVFVGLLPLVIGLAALYLYPPAGSRIPAELADGAAIFAVLMRDYSPVWLNVLLGVGLVAASMSTIDTCGNVVALSASYDLAEPALHHWSLERRHRLARSMSAGAIGVSLVYAFFTESLWDVFYLSSGILTTTVSLPMLALFMKRVRPAQVHAAIAAGFVGTLVFYFLESRGLLAALEPVWLAKTGLGYILWGWVCGLVGLLQAPGAKLQEPS